MEKTSDPRAILAGEHAEARRGHHVVLIHAVAAHAETADQVAADVQRRTPRKEDDAVLIRDGTGIAEVGPDVKRSLFITLSNAVAGIGAPSFSAVRGLIPGSFKIEKIGGTVPSTPDG